MSPQAIVLANADGTHVGGAHYAGERVRSPASVLGIKVAIVRYVSDEPQPGIVECQLEDAYGRVWTIIEKTAIVSTEYLDAETAYPREGLIAGQVVEHVRDPAGREIVSFDLQYPWGVETIDGVTRFDVLSSSLVEW